MGLLSFSIADMVPDIQCGAKAHTIRRDGGVERRVGEDLWMWFRPRQPMYKRYLGVATCTKVQGIVITPDDRRIVIDGEALSPVQCDSLALADGFATPNDFWAYFAQPLTGKIIYWNRRQMSGLELRPVVAKWVGVAVDGVSTLQGEISASDLTADWCNHCKRAGGCPLLTGEVHKQWVSTTNDVAACRSFDPKQKVK